MTILVPNKLKNCLAKQVSGDELVLQGSSYRRYRISGNTKLVRTKLTKAYDVIKKQLESHPVAEHLEHYKRLAGPEELSHWLAKACTSISEKDRCLLIRKEYLL